MGTRSRITSKVERDVLRQETRVRAERAGGRGPGRAGGWASASAVADTQAASPSTARHASITSGAVPSRVCGYHTRGSPATIATPAARRGIGVDVEPVVRRYVELALVVLSGRTENKTEPVANEVLQPNARRTARRSRGGRSSRVALVSCRAWACRHQVKMNSASGSS